MAVRACAAAVVAALGATRWTYGPLYSFAAPPVGVHVAHHESPASLLSGGASSKPSPVAALTPATRLAATKSSAAQEAPEAAPGMMPTGEAAFLTAADQPLQLSPNGLRTARFEYHETGLLLRVEAAPAFGPPGTGGFAVATERDLLEVVKIIPADRLGLTGVRDLFWLDDRRFLITGYEGQTGKFYGWLADLRAEKATVITMPYQESSLFVPLDLYNSPHLRYDERGDPEVLLGFTTETYDGNVTRTWDWYSIGTGDLEDASPIEDLPSDLWREVEVARTGEIEAIMLVNGSVYRRSPMGWGLVGDVALAAAEGEAAVTGLGTTLQRKYLVSAGPDYSVYVLDVLGSDATVPAVTPPPEDLTLAFSEDMPTADSIDGPAWVLQQCQEKQTAALVRLTDVGSRPEPVFAHPFADVTVQGVWVNPETGTPEAVTVEDLRSRCYSLTKEHATLLATLQYRLPSTVEIGDTKVPSAVLEPQLAERHQSRWLISYFHPALSRAVVLPAVVEDGMALWIGKDALRARGAALNPGAIPLKPRMEGHRIWVGAHDVPVYLQLPEAGDPSALVVRVHEGANSRSRWGADDLDGWLLSRGYGILKVNHRGSNGYGREWSSLSPGSEAGGGYGFLDDIVAGVRWALDKRKVFGGAAGDRPPVAIMGSYFGGYVALHALRRQKDLFACGIAVAPLQQLDEWPERFVPDAEAWQAVEAARAGLAGLSEEAAGTVLAPPSFAGALRDSNLLVFEYENDAPEHRGALLPELSPPGLGPETWPSKVRLVQYASEGRGGGTFRQNLVDQHRRIDSFLYQHLSRRAADGGAALQHETFVDELPFVSACLVPPTKGLLSETAKGLESGFSEGLKSKSPSQALQLPDTYVASGKPGQAGFASTNRRKTGKRSPLVSPASRLSVRSDGTTEIVVMLPEAPTDLHVLLSELWFHIRAKGFGYTVALPRQPKRPAKIEAVRLANSNSYVFSIPGNSVVGAVQSYQEWARAGGRATVLTWLTPSEIADAPMVYPREAPTSGDDSTISAAVEVVAEASAESLGLGPDPEPSQGSVSPEIIDVVDV